LGERTGIISLAGTFALGAAAIAVHPTRSGRTIAAARTGTLVIGITVWIIALTIQDTNLLMSNAQDAVASDISYLVLTELGHVVWLASFTIIAVGLALAGFRLHRNPAVRSWTEWIAWIAAAAIAACVVTLHYVPSFTVFLLALPALGIAALPARVPSAPALGRPRP
jgi:hypothetical protein